MNEQPFVDHLARMLAKARNHGSVRMVGHNPLPSEVQQAQRFVEDFLRAIAEQKTAP